MAKTSLAQQVKRYIWLAQTIKNKPRTRAEINDRWCVSDLNEDHEDAIPESTFYRWRNEVQSLFDIDIECENGEYFIANNGEQDEFRQWLIESFSVSNILKDSRELQNQILFEPVGQRYLIEILEAMRARHSLQITHQSFGRKEPSKRTVEPYCLKMFRQRWYMVANVREYNEWRVYSLDRISEVVQTDESYTIPDGFDANKFFRHTYGVTMSDDEPQKVVISIDNYQANYLKTLPLHPSQEEMERGKDETVFSFYVYITEDFLRELRAYGPKLKVLKPDSLRKTFLKEAKEQCKIYAASK